MRSLILLAVLSSTAVLAKPVRKPVEYDAGGTKMEGVLVYDDLVKTARPGLLLVPNWLGINEANLKQAELVAAKQYVIFVADMYGKDGRPKNMEEAGKAAGAVKGDRKLMRERAAKSLETFLSSAKTLIDSKKVGAIGFCFGGTTALELAKAGANLGGVVAFHAGIDAAMPAVGKPNARILALQGADDPFQKPEDTKAFEEELRKLGADWTLVEFGGAVHSYTDVDAHAKGQADYNPVVARRAYKLMNDFFAETFGG